MQGVLHVTYLATFTNVYYLRLLISSATGLIILQDTVHTYLRL